MKQKIFNLIILDASGSMYSIKNEAIAGVVETIQTIRTAQKENANQEHLLSLVVFNGKSIATIYDRMPITTGEAPKTSSWIPCTFTYCRISWMGEELKVSGIGVYEKV